MSTSPGILFGLHFSKSRACHGSLFEFICVCCVWKTLCPWGNLLPIVLLQRSLNLKKGFQ